MWMCVGMRGYAQGCAVYTGVCTGVRRCVKKCMGVCECVRGMNSQNIYWRIESLDQRTLIRIFFQKMQNSKNLGIYVSNQIGILTLSKSYVMHIAQSTTYNLIVIFKMLKIYFENFMIQIKFLK